MNRVEFFFPPDVPPHNLRTGAWKPVLIEFSPEDAETAVRERFPGVTAARAFDDQGREFCGSRRAGMWTKRWLG